MAPPDQAAAERTARRREEMLRVIGGVLLLAFTVYTLVECIQTEPENVRNLPKPAWMLLILFFPLVGGISWYVAGRPSALISLDGPGARGSRPSAPRGPDDDPDFLGRL